MSTRANRLKETLKRMRRRQSSSFSEESNDELKKMLSKKRTKDESVSTKWEDYEVDDYCNRVM